MSIKIVTTSWDDGYRESMDIAKMLERHKLRGTFYVPVNAIRGGKVETIDPGEMFLSEDELRKISEDFEIGGHGVAHPFLTEVSKREAEEEINDSKKILEDILGKKIHGFAYPGGKFNEEIVNMIRRAGYSYARAAGREKLNFSDRYRVPVTIFCYNSLIRKAKFSLFAPFSKVYAFGGDWATSILKAFENVKKRGGTLHIAEHPNRMRNAKFRKKIEKVFSKISGHPDVEYLTNKEAVERVLGGGSK